MSSESNKKELIEKVSRLVRNRFGGSYKAAFAQYSRQGSPDDKVSEGELRDLLADAGIGNGITRGAWSSGIMRQLDGDRDGMISWSEFETVTKR